MQSKVIIVYKYLENKDNTFMLLIIIIKKKCL